MDMRVVLVPGKLELKNPILSASGTFGYGTEYSPYGDITGLGGIITNGITLEPCAGAPMPRIVETPSGVLRAVGTQNGGARHFADEILPGIPWNQVPVIPNLNATNVDDFAAISDILSAERGVAAMEINLSCPNDHRNGQPFCQNPVTAARAVNSVRRSARGKPIIAKLSPRTIDIVEV
ncbi:MAG: dihydroorotate dehydrogenase, partial [Mailhella sp.]|nr:dihydroorotate dehydrogenase [Mailhella sp.]